MITESVRGILIRRTIGGARIGVWFNATWPFAALSIYEYELTLRIFGYEYRFPKKELSGIEKVGCIPMFWSGIQLWHQSVVYPKTIIFWALNRNSLWNILRDHGYPVGK